MPDPLERLAADANRLAAEHRRVPGATYRLQVHKDFNLRDLVRITPYLHSLGITHAYTSSLLAAKPGSTHGYDVIDHGRLNPEIGTDAEFDDWIAKLRELGMGLLLDTVPNHMSVGGPNEWWADVLEHGPVSPFAGHFDIAWEDHPRERLHGKVLLPILGQTYGAEIEGGRFRVEFADGAFAIRYGEMRLPIDPRTYGIILTPALEAAREELGADNPDIGELQSILTAARNLPPRSETDPARSTEGWNESKVIKRRLGELAGRSEVIARQNREAAKRLSGTVGDPASFAALEELLDAQAYRPSFWRVASDEINYRRFFDVNDLAALSTEQEEVFAAVHRKVFHWIGVGQLDGVRIDHPDGLFDPKQYLDRLQVHAKLAAARHLLATRSEEYPGLTWVIAEGPLNERFSTEPGHPLYVVVEKILGEGEPLPTDWATDGTIGYEFVNLVNSLFVDPARDGDMTRVYRDLTGEDIRFDDLVYQCKFHVLQSSLASELHVLAHQLDRIAQAQRWSRDFTLNGLRHALREVIACFPVYRSYVNGGVGDRDRIVILRAVARAKARNPLLGRAVFDFIRDTLLLKDPQSGPAAPEYQAAQRRFAGKFQQVTAPAMAKGFEDTALYVYSRLVSLNEVGGEPSKFGRPPADVHRFLRSRAEKYSGALSPLSTHDTKRSEDVRARIDALSEIPDSWAAHVASWMDLNWPHKVDLGDGQSAPDPNEEYFLYQTLIGTWPIEGLTSANRAAYVKRIQAYMNKALHEAKVHTSWINPNPEYDAAAAEFVSRVLDPDRPGTFLREFEPFQKAISQVGMFTSLAQTLLKVALPGVPDTYQGSELWDFSLVDPDNRRPVDYELRARLLADLDRRAKENCAALTRELVEQIEGGRIKLYVTAQSLRFRRERGGLFARGDYVPLEASGPRAGHAFCFLRILGESFALVLVPRLIASLVLVPGSPPLGEDVWGNTVVPLPEPFGSLRWTNRLTGYTIEPQNKLPVARVLGHFPVALLEGRPASQ
ncbi:MAG TPA: malto-oligosyltrehalose synthase [Gemmataceae bacterium]|nr:malto-oligosyltrehalose synthase [Gemmataceae bacterium]